MPNKKQMAAALIIAGLLVLLAQVIYLRVDAEPEPTAVPIVTEIPEGPADVAADEEPEAKISQGSDKTLDSSKQVPSKCQVSTKSIPTQTPSAASDELDLLARLIAGEMGASWAPDEQQLYVGSVALNRVNSSEFPNSLSEVIYQRGQYSCAEYLDSITPDARTIANARKLLENGPVLPADVVFQSESPQGPVYTAYYDKVLGTTTYYCTKGD